MQSDIITRYSGMNPQALKNADINNWKWNSSDSPEWTLAKDKWQNFSSQWYGKKEIYLSLGSSLSLEPIVPRRQPRILVRECYLEIFRRVWARAFDSDGLTGAIITGQPGTGKSLLDFYFLVMLLQHEQIVLFSSDGISVYLFYCGKVYQSTSARLATPEAQLPEPKSRNLKLFIWSIFDIAKREEPASFFFDHPCLPVQTASPDPVRYKIWAKDCRPMWVGMPLWTRSELVLGLGHQAEYDKLKAALEEYCLDGSKDALTSFPGTRELLDAHVEDEDDARPSAEDALEYLLGESLYRFGYSARDVYDGLFNYEGTTLRHEDAFQTDYDQLIKAVRALASNDSAPHAISHKILALTPMDPVDFKDVFWEVDFKSLWVLKTMIRRLGDAEHTRIGQFISFLHCIKAASQMAGRLLEPFAHREIAEAPAGGFWPLAQMTRTNDNDNSPTFKSSPVPQPALDLFPKVKREIVKFFSLASEVLTQNTYYIPNDPNFPLFDAFTFELDPPNKLANLWLLQMTTARLHGGASQGYKHIRVIIAKLKALLTPDSPQPKARKLAAGQSASSVTVRVRYLLVVPKGNVDRRWDFPPEWNMSCKRHDHRGEVYCLEVAVGVEDIVDSHKT